MKNDLQRGQGIPMQSIEVMIARAGVADHLRDRAEWLRMIRLQQGR
jgi:hypothetical protein